MLYYTMLYYTILYDTILYYTILYYTIRYYTILYDTILYYTMLYYKNLCKDGSGPSRLGSRLDLGIGQAPSHLRPGTEPEPKDSRRYIEYKKI